MTKLNEVSRAISGAPQHIVPAAKALMDAIKQHIRPGRNKPAGTPQGNTPPRQSTQPASPEASRAQWQHIVERATERIANKQSDTSPTYPVDALGDLAEVVKVVAHHAQLEQALTAQSFLAAASLLTAPLYKVGSSTGPKPLNLFFMMQALSGDGKTTAESIALSPVITWEKANPGKRVLLRDGTVAAIMRDLSKSKFGIMGLMSSEGGTFFGGHSFKGENKQSTAATLNALWDSGELSYSRVTSGDEVHMYDRYLVMSLSAQPSVTAHIVSDPQLADIGFLARLLYAIPPASQPRLGRSFDLTKNEAMVSYCARATALLSRLSDERKIQLLAFDPDAQDFALRAFERYEYEAKKGSMQHIRSFGIRASEQLCRLAGVLAAWSDRSTVCINDVVSAKKLVDYSLNCWSHALVAAPDAMKAEAALKIISYMADNGGVMSAKLSLGPGPRKKDDRRPALDLLMHLGLVHRVGDHFELIP